VTVNGTRVNAIAVALSGGKIKVTRNGMTQSVSSTGISRVELFAGAGNDNVTIGAGVPSPT
jgi:hypothetical protein